jgi:hypothetical protein
VKEGKAKRRIKQDAANASAAQHGFTPSPLFAMLGLRNRMNRML